MPTTRDTRILALLNGTDDPASLSATIQTGTSGDRGVGPGFAAWLLRVRDEMYGGRFTAVAQVDGVYGMGSETLGDISDVAWQQPPYASGAGIEVPAPHDPEQLMAELGVADWQEERVIRFFNIATAADIVRTVLDDPDIGSSSPLAYGIRHGLAEWMIRVRDEMFGGAYRRISDLADIHGVGTDTMFDIVRALLTVPVEFPPEVIRRLREATRVVVVTGAGVSEPSGLVSPLDGVDPEDVWTPDAFVDDIAGVWVHHLALLAKADDASPNAAHTRIAELAHYVLDKPNGRFTLATQNQDRLHQAADPAWGETSPPPYPIIELHGELFYGVCMHCGELYKIPKDAGTTASNYNLPANWDGPLFFMCPQATCSGLVRPVVTWLTEPYAPGTLDKAGAAVVDAQVVLFIGTSGNVLPVRWLLHEAHWHARAYTVVIEDNASAWTTRDGTPDWPGTPIVDAVIQADVVDAMESLAALVGW